MRLGAGVYIRAPCFAPWPLGQLCAASRARLVLALAQVELRVWFQRGAVSQKVFIDTIKVLGLDHEF